MGNTLPCCKEEQQNHPIPFISTPRCINEPNSNKQVLTPIGKPFNFRAQVETTPNTPKQDKRSRGPQNYQSVKLLGKGSFGMVVLAEQKQTNRRFAMKMIPKSKINESNLLQTKLIPEIRNHPFLTTVYETFQNNDNIYVVMEYLPKEDLYFYIRRQGLILADDTIRDVVAEIVVGVEFLHKQGIVYRGLKPENILVTDEGHIKLTDYGLSKVLIQDRSQRGISTFFGAMEYMAPEVISGHYDQKVDLWALGILLYEMKFKENAIEHEGQTNHSIADYEMLLNKNFIQQKINNKIGRMSQEFRELLLRLLEKDPNARISLQELHCHPFFEKVDWKQVEERVNAAPLAQIVKKNDSIKFKDPMSEESKRRQVFKRHGCNNQNFLVNLIEVRMSE